MEQKVWCPAPPTLLLPSFKMSVCTLFSESQTGRGFLTDYFMGEAKTMYFAYLHHEKELN